MRNSSATQGAGGGANLGQAAPTPPPTPPPCFSIESAWIKGNKRPDQTPGGGREEEGVEGAPPTETPRLFIYTQGPARVKLPPTLGTVWGGGGLHRGLFAAEVTRNPGQSQDCPHSRATRNRRSMSHLASAPPSVTPPHLLNTTVLLAASLSRNGRLALLPIGEINEGSD